KPWLEKPVKWIATKIRKGITPEMPKRMPRLVREIANACFQFEPDKRPTFKQVNGRILMVQGIRFPPLHPSLLSMAQLKNVKPIKFIEKDPEAITIELDDAKSEEQQPDEFEDAEPKKIRLSEARKKIIVEEHEKPQQSKREENLVRIEPKEVADMMGSDEEKSSRDIKKSLEDRHDKNSDQKQ
ncbi:unnamed protein product, partial [Onchocerca ochengi]|uniref:Protein kinase domain-containing protein n=1 Tax=Onchocerca ochengi TaxID=42157 RepID=A0A182EIR3_ONCOC